MGMFICLEARRALLLMSTPLRGRLARLRDPHRESTVTVHPAMWTDLEFFNQTINSFDASKHLYSVEHYQFRYYQYQRQLKQCRQVLKANANGFFAAAHIFVTTYFAGAMNSEFVNGFAADGAQVPDGGATVILLFTALERARYGATLLCPSSVSVLAPAKRKWPLNRTPIFIPHAVQVPIISMG